MRTKSIILSEAVSAVAPISGISVGRWDDKSTWRVDFAEQATSDQRAAAQAVLAEFDADMVPPWQVPTPLIVDRLIASGCFEAANAALEANPSQKARFYTRGFINSDNQEARAFLAAIGADPDVILAAGEGS